ncbi:hypothetical protein GCM10023065_22280 [Microbacterium laevaniformans]|nr:hypothetical protein GCM10017578_21910 [Microbacterium laevaniformans]
MTARNHAVAAIAHHLAEALLIALEAAQDTRTDGNPRSATPHIRRYRRERADTPRSRASGAREQAATPQKPQIGPGAQLQVRCATDCAKPAKRVPVYRGRVATYGAAVGFTVGVGVAVCDL